MKYILLYCVLLMVVLTGCNFGVDYSSTPQDVYRIVMKLYRQNYAYIHEAPRTHKELFDEYWPRVQNLKATKDGWRELAQILQDFMDLIEDGHIDLKHDFEVSHIPGEGDISTKIRPRSSEEQAPTAESLESKVNIHGNSFAYIHGQIKDKGEIGYILVKELNKNTSAFGRVNDDRQWLKKIDSIINDLKSRGVKKMILDIRSSAGGSQTNAEYIIARFIKKTSPYMVSYDLVGPAESRDSYKRQVISFSPNSSGARFSGPVVLLMNANTGSGGEIFVLTALQIPGIKTIGTNTNGLPGSITVYDLPNHWKLQLTTSKTYPLKPDGSDGINYLTVGIPPDIDVENIPGSGKDEVLERGIMEIESM